MRMTRWQRLLLPVSGAWMLCSPFTIPAYAAESPVALWASLVAGAVLLILAAIALAKPGPWLDWAGLGVAGWLIVAPLLLGFAEEGAKAASNHILIGMLVGLVALGLIALHREEQTRPDEIN